MKGLSRKVKKNRMVGLGVVLGLIVTLALIVGTPLSVFAAEYDMTTAGHRELINNAVFESFQPDDPTGSGVFYAFVRISANTDVEQGYNTVFRPLEFDENSSPSFTRSIRLSQVPLIPVTPPGGTLGLYREFQLDINQTKKDPFLSLDELEIYLTKNPSLTGYPFPGTATKIWELDAGGADDWLKLDYKLNEGSGKRDLRVWIPNDLFNQLGYTNCAYNPDDILCDTYVVLYSRFGEHYANNDGFEEWGVAIYEPATKSGVKFLDANANGIKDAGETTGLSGWTIYVDYNDNGTLDAGEPSAVTGAGGTYTITGIVPGTYKVREVPQAGWTQSIQH